MTRAPIKRHGGRPDERLLAAVPELLEGERLVLLGAADDLGLLADTAVTARITPTGQFITRKMGEVHGLGAWARGVRVRFATDPSEVPALFLSARQFARLEERP